MASPEKKVFWILPIILLSKIYLLIFLQSLGGHVNNVILKAYDVKSAPDIQSIEPRFRKCLFPRERKLKLYKSYSQSCCLLECKLQFAQSRTHFNCTPWYFPTQDQPIQMCDPWQSQKMEQLMFRDIPPNQCHHCHPGNYIISLWSNAPS